MHILQFIMEFSIADIIALQKWLLNDDTELANWQAADFSKDNILIDCQVKCNTIREKIFEASQRESEN